VFLNPKNDTTEDFSKCCILFGSRDVKLQGLIPLYNCIHPGTSIASSNLTAMLDFSRSMMRYGVDIFLPSSWEPQEEGMMSIAARFLPQLRNQGMSIRRGRSQYD
jgi:hypothetical protein